MIAPPPFHQPPAPSSAVSDRRRACRVDVLGQVQAHSVWKMRPVTLRELTLTGFSLETTSPLEPGSLQRFRLGFDDNGPSVIVQALCRHSALMSTAGALPIYIVGFEFVEVNEMARSQIRNLVQFAEGLWADS